MAQFGISVVEKGRSGSTYSLDADLDGKATVKELQIFLKSALASVAKEVIKDAVKNRGFDPSYVRLVDGKANLPEEAVSPLGKIEYIARQNLKEIILETFKAVIARSAKDTGRYIRSHIVTYNGEPVAKNLPQLQAWLKKPIVFESKDRIRIINVQPYARKLERYGVTAQTKGMGVSDKVRRYGMNKKGERTGGKGIRSDAVGMLIPNGTYALTARAIERKYGKNAYISYRLVDGGELGNEEIAKQTYKTDAASKHFKAGSRKRTLKNGSRKGLPYFYPSILIKVIARAIKQ